MELYDSKISVFKIDDTGGNLRDVSDYITDLVGLPAEAPLIDVSTFGDSGEYNVKGLPRGPFAIDLKWSADASVGPATVFYALLDHETPVDFEYYPAGVVSGKPKITGQCFVEIVADEERVGEYIKMAVALRTNNGYTLGSV